MKKIDYIIKESRPDGYVGEDGLHNILDNHKKDIIIYGGRDYKSYFDDNYTLQLLDDNDDSKIDKDSGFYTIHDIMCSFIKGWAIKCVLVNLKDITGKEWHVDYIKGYSQSEWAIVFYTDNVNSFTISMIGDYYFGCYKIFEVCENGEDNGYTDIVTDSEVGKEGSSHTYKEVFKDRLGENIKVLMISGSHTYTSYSYEEEK